MSDPHAVAKKVEQQAAKFVAYIVAGVRSVMHGNPDFEAIMLLAIEDKIRVARHEAEVKSAAQRRP